MKRLIHNLPCSTLMSLALAVALFGMSEDQPAAGHELHIHNHQAPKQGMVGTRVQILMKDGVYHVMNGTGTEPKNLILKAGEESTIILHNEDGVAHEFISPLFTRTEVRFAGKATGIFGKDAAGFRLDPGKVLVLQFQAPDHQPFKTMFDVMWCNLHKTADAEAQEGEILLVATNGGL